MKIIIETTDEGISTISRGVNVANADELLSTLRTLNNLEDHLASEYLARFDQDYFDDKEEDDNTINIKASDIFPELGLSALPKFDDDPNPN